MKIYNKKKFYFSLLWLAMGISIMILTLVNGDMNLDSVFSAACCCILGINGLGRSISQKMSREDKVEELDERNQLIELKSKRKGFQLIQYTLLCVGFVFAILGGIYKDMILGAVGITSTIIWVFSLVIDWLTFVYYDSKN